MATHKGNTLTYLPSLASQRRQLLLDRSPLVYFFLCVCLPLTTHSGFYLLLSVSPGGDIYQTSGRRPSLSTGLDLMCLGLSPLFSALCLEKEWGRWGLEREFLTKLPSSAVKRYLRWGAGEFPTGHIPLSFFYLCINLHQSGAHEKYPCDHETVNSCATLNGNCVLQKGNSGQAMQYCCLSEPWVILTP